MRKVMISSVHPSVRGRTSNNYYCLLVVVTKIMNLYSFMLINKDASTICSS